MYGQILDGSIYFQSSREGGFGLADIYLCSLVNDEFQEATILPEPINNSGFQGDTYISPDEDYAIVSTTQNGTGWSDLFISFRDKEGNWGELINMGREINSPLSENTQIVSHDGKYLFYKSRKRKNADLGKTKLTYRDIKNIFTSPQNGNGDIYWVNAEIIEEIRMSHYR